MGTSLYGISIVERGKEALWRELWCDPDGEPSAAARKANKNGALGRTEFVKAKNLSEAMAKVAALHPDCAVMPEGSSRIA